MKAHFRKNTDPEVHIGITTHEKNFNVGSSNQALRAGLSKYGGGGVTPIDIMVDKVLSIADRTSVRAELKEKKGIKLKTIDHIKEEYKKELSANSIDGLIIPGSGDNVSKALYDKKYEIEKLNENNNVLEKQELKEFDYCVHEIAVLQASIDRSIPVMGICYGLQLIAAAMGGTLKEKPIDKEGWDIIPKTGTLKNKAYIVDSNFNIGDMGFFLHNYCIDKMPENAKITGERKRKPDGEEYVCGFETKEEESQIVAYQFHPELNTDFKEDKMKDIKDPKKRFNSELFKDYMSKTYDNRNMRDKKDLGFHSEIENKYKELEG